MTLDTQQFFNKWQASFGPNLTVTICYKGAKALCYMLWQFTCSSKFNLEIASVKPWISSWQLTGMWWEHRLWHGLGCWHANKVLRCVMQKLTGKGLRTTCCSFDIAISVTFPKQQHMHTPNVKEHWGEEFWFLKKV